MVEVINLFIFLSLNYDFITVLIYIATLKFDLS